MSCKAQKLANILSAFFRSTEWGISHQGQGAPLWLKKNEAIKIFGQKVRSACLVFIYIFRTKAKEVFFKHNIIN